MVTVVVVVIPGSRPAGLLASGTPLSGGYDQANEKNCFFFRPHNIYNVMRSGRAVMPWPGTPWVWRSVSSPTLLTSCRFFIAKS